MFFAVDFGLAVWWLGLWEQSSCRAGHGWSSRTFQVCLKERAHGSQGRSCSRPVWYVVQLTRLGPKVSGLRNPGPGTQPTCAPAAQRPPSLVRKCVLLALRQGPVALGRRGPPLPWKAGPALPPLTPFSSSACGPQAPPLSPMGLPAHAQRTQPADRRAPAGPGTRAAEAGAGANADLVLVNRRPLGPAQSTLPAALAAGLALSRV